MNIRLASPADLPRIEEIYTIGRAYMRQTGNMTQWIGGYPQRNLLEEDIAKEQLFVMEDERGIHGVFAFILGEDPTYGYIDGAWPNAKPYGTIHRIASDGTHRGVLAECVRWSMAQIPHLRIDTHESNLAMRGAIERLGFTYCGTIYIADGTPRRAYELI
mgnify:CR=1 FL=1